MLDLLAIGISSLLLALRTWLQQKIKSLKVREGLLREHAL